MKTWFFCLVLMVFPLGLNAQVVNFPVYPNSVLIEKDTKETDKQKDTGIKLATYKYSSDHSEQEIKHFFKERLLRQGWLENKDMPGSFAKKNRQITLRFHPSLHKNKIIYLVMVEEGPAYDQEANCPAGGCPKPKPMQKYGVKPVSPPGSELISTDSTDMDRFVFRSKNNPSAIKNFYLEKMSALGWSLKEQQDKGEFDFRKSVCSDCPGISAEQEELLSEISRDTVNLVFKKRNTFCRVFISPYLYPESETRDSTFPKNNDTIIGISYYVGKNK